MYSCGAIRVATLALRWSRLPIVEADLGKRAVGSWELKDDSAAVGGLRPHAAVMVSPGVAVEGRSALGSVRTSDGRSSTFDSGAGGLDTRRLTFP